MADPSPVKNRERDGIDWRYADHLSDQIVELTNQELNRMTIDGHLGPYDLLAGQLLALKALLLTAPKTDNRPPWLDALDRAVDLSLNGILKQT